MSCPDCFSGSIHSNSNNSETPKGKVTKLHGLDVYVSEPAGLAPGADVKGIIVIIPDGFGWEFVNNRILADHYAEKGGYRVYLPDFMRGHAAPVWTIETMRSLMRTDSILNWVMKPYHLFWALYAIIPFRFHNSFAKSWPIVTSFFTAVRENEGRNLPIGAAGFCWGGKHTVHLAHGLSTPATSDGTKPSRPLIDAAFTGHPSMLHDIPDEVGRIRIPTSFAIGDQDLALREKHIEQIRRALDQDRGEVRIYPGAGHGFCVRADHVLVDAERQASEAEDQAISWFQRHFRDVDYSVN